MKLINITNHTLMPSQVKDAEEAGHTIVELTPELKTLWGNIPPEYDRGQVREFVQPIIEFIKAEVPSNEDCLILLAGDFGATFAVYDQLPYGAKAIQSTMHREAQETLLEDGSTKTIHILNHVRFRYL